MASRQSIASSERFVREIRSYFDWRPKAVLKARIIRIAVPPEGGRQTKSILAAAAGNRSLLRRTIRGQPMLGSFTRPRSLLTTALCVAKLNQLCSTKCSPSVSREKRFWPHSRNKDSSMKSPWIPRALCEAPALDPSIHAGPPRPKLALLINPFYPKDPHASFGKHVLTPSLALTSIAGATPPDWDVAYWDENLLQGPPPWQPFPQVVGITVHLTFAGRAYELAAWYRQRGAEGRPGRAARPVVSRRGRPARRRPGDRRGRAGLAGDPPRRRGRNARADVYRGSYRRPYREDPPPRRDLLPRRSFLTTTSLIATRGCHNRCGFCYLATDGLDDAVSGSRRAAGGGRVRWPTGSPTPSSSTTTSARAASICERFAWRFGRWE